MTPDALVALCERWTEDLRAEYGDEWIEGHAGLWRPSRRSSSKTRRFTATSELLL